MEAFPSSPPSHFAKWHPPFKQRIELVIIKLISAMVSGLDHLAKQLRENFGQDREEEGKEC